tara:strand:+ start:198 stop:368 length:171 start_codon:yes stop_codon:yes gene_type:complete
MEFLILIAIIIGIFIIGGVVTIWNNDDSETMWSTFIIGGCLFLIIAILIRILIVLG